MLTKELEETLGLAVDEAVARRHEIPIAAQSSRSKYLFQINLRIRNYESER